MLKYLLLFLTILLTSCAQTKTEVMKPTIVTETVYIKVPVKCKIPSIDCEFKGDGFKPTENLLKCLIKQKEVITICSEKIEDNVTRP